MNAPQPYDAILLVSFGGPDGPEDVMPFLRNVVAGRGVPEERLLAVAEHYKALGGKSPLNDQCRDLLAALIPALREHHIELPVYWGNRNWHPMLADTLTRMRDDGVKRAVAIVTSAFSSYSGCRQYREDIEKAREQVEGAPVIEKVRTFYNHPDFLGTVVDAVQASLSDVPLQRRGSTRLVFTAHSIPLGMATGCDYEAQLREAGAFVAQQVGESAHDLVYQSRSGPPQVPWLTPDVLDHIRQLHEQGVTDVVLSPIGFLSDHMEVVWDLDHEAKSLCTELGMTLHRVPTPGVAPRFVHVLRELIEERLGLVPTRRAIEGSAPRPDTCAPTCCLYTPRRPPGAGGPPAGVGGRPGRPT